MAELLLYFKPAEVDPTAPNDPVRRFGDIVHVLPDGSQWGRQECLDDFLVIRVEGLACEEAWQYAGPLLRETLVAGLPGVEIAAPSRYTLTWPHWIMTTWPWPTCPTGTCPLSRQWSSWLR